jgi:hypothetical protein
MIEINSEAELKELFDTYICKSELNESSFRKTRYIDHSVSNNLDRYKLNFEPYIKIADRCGMNYVDILRSKQTNRFYLGFLNTGGHGAVYEIRPSRLSDILNYGYIEDMFANHAQKLDWGIDINEEYEV